MEVMKESGILAVFHSDIIRRGETSPAMGRIFDNWDRIHII